MNGTTDFQPGDQVKIRGQRGIFRVISVGISPPDQGWVKIYGGLQGSGSTRSISPFRLQLIQRPPTPGPTEPSERHSKPLDADQGTQPFPRVRRASPGLPRTCAECGNRFTPPSKPGRPPLYCPDCQAKTNVRERARIKRQAEKPPRQTEKVYTCSRCGVSFVAEMRRGRSVGRCEKCQKTART